MNWRQHRWKDWRREEDGPSAVEYAVMLAMIVITCVGAIRSVGDATFAHYNTISGDIAQTAPEFPVGATSPGYREVPPVGKWTLNLAGGTTVVHDVETGIETTYWAGGGTNTATYPPGNLGSDRGQLWTRTE